MLRTAGPGVGVGLFSRRGTRLASDSLRFTGIGLGDREDGGALRRSGCADDSFDDSDMHSSDGDDGDDDDGEGADDDEHLALIDPEEREEYLVRRAMDRINRAQARGRDDVSLTKTELEALERWRRRIEEEEEEERRERRRRRKHRVSVPLSQLETVSRKSRSSRDGSEPSSSRHPSTDSRASRPSSSRQAYPPLGLFPPPSSASDARSRRRSGTTTSAYRPDGREPSFQYDYVQRPASSASRHVSDSLTSAGGPRSSRNAYQADPYQLHTVGSRAPPASSSAGAAAASSSRRHTASDAAYSSAHQRASAPALPVPGRSGGHDYADETMMMSSDEGGGSRSSEQSTSDDLNSGARIAQAEACAEQR
ncbi:PRA1 family protein [Geosmithia morbida]|uniref:PRA1 family protein n=1 Tax=Geosmithia morbida TaxID=1094350 RepID=A0A9P4YUV2_9HYPO|nr:PRA1 family protein [Geosmithia morbida]KAF4123533.1 PRA1 family protein [Geosmithia morbida]